MPPLPAYWTAEELAADAAEARRVFVRQRLALEDDDQRYYGGVLAEAMAAARRLVEASDGLRALDGAAMR